MINNKFKNNLKVLISKRVFKLKIRKLFSRPQVELVLNFKLKIKNYETDIFRLCRDNTG